VSRRRRKPRPQAPLEAKPEAPRREQALERQAYHQGWLRTPEEVTRIAGRLLKALDDPDHRPATLAGRALMAGDLRQQEIELKRRGLDQDDRELELKGQTLQLAREKHEGKKDAISLADLVQDAESLAEARVVERDRDPQGPAGRDGPAG
jgi:hypothetical protein